MIQTNQILNSLWELARTRWRSGGSTRLPLMWPGFKSRRRRHMWVEFVVGSPLCSERFFFRYSGCPLSSKTNISKFQCDQESGRRRTTLWRCYLQIVIYYYLFIYLHDRSQAFLKRLKLLSGEIACQKRFVFYR